jgi:hypothetical protein
MRKANGMYSASVTNAFVFPKEAAPLAPQLNALRDRMYAVVSTAGRPTKHRGLTAFLFPARINHGWGSCKVTYHWSGNQGPSVKCTHTHTACKAYVDV